MDYVTERGRKSSRRPRGSKKKRYDPSRRVFARVKYLRVESSSNTSCPVIFRVLHAARICAPRWPEGAFFGAFGRVRKLYARARLCTHAYYLCTHADVSRVAGRPSLPRNFFAQPSTASLLGYISLFKKLIIKSSGFLRYLFFTFIVLLFYIFSIFIFYGQFTIQEIRYV